MHGWRGRIGLLVPSSNTTAEPEFCKMAPRGVSVHTARMRVTEQTVEAEIKMVENLEQVALEVADADVDVIVFACTTGSLQKGIGYDKKLAQRIQRATKTTAIITASAVIDALKALRVRSISVATPYPRDLNENVKLFLESNGFKVLNIRGLDLIRNTDVGKQEPHVAYMLAKSVDNELADVIFISCTNFRTMEIIDLLEHDLNKPVISSNQATMWATLRQLKVVESLPGYGKLMQLLRE